MLHFLNDHTLSTAIVIAAITALTLWKMRRPLFRSHLWGPAVFFASLSAISLALTAWPWEASAYTLLIAALFSLVATLIDVRRGQGARGRASSST